MKDHKGITLITVIIAVVILIILAGAITMYSRKTYDSAKIVKFETNMKAIQKKVDITLEEGIDYTTVGTALTEAQKTDLASILTNKPNIYTRNAQESTLRYFSPQDIENTFGISDIEGGIVINFANRDVISLIGVEKDGVTYYTAYTLP